MGYRNYSPKKVYDSPFIDSDFGSGIVTIRKGGHALVLDFNNGGNSKP